MYSLVVTDIKCVGYVELDTGELHVPATTDIAFFGNVFVNKDRF